MKNAIIVLSALLLVVTIGCGKKEEGASPDVEKGLAEMKLENAPTLGPVYKKYLQAEDKKDWGAQWDLMSSGGRQYTEMTLKAIKDAAGAKYFEDQKTGQQTMMEMPDMTETQKANFAAMIKKYDKCIADINKIKDMSPKEYYIYDRENKADFKADTTTADANAEMYKMVCEKEEINGDDGKIIFKMGEETMPMPFTKEDGAWKFGPKMTEMP